MKNYLSRIVPAAGFLPKLFPFPVNSHGLATSSDGGNFWGGFEKPVTLLTPIFYYFETLCPFYCKKLFICKCDLFIYALYYCPKNPDLFPSFSRGVPILLI